MNTHSWFDLDTIRAACDQRVVVGPMDPPAWTLRTGETLARKHIVFAAPAYGRVLFTNVVAVEIPADASDITIRDCVFEQI